MKSESLKALNWECHTPIYFLRSSLMLCRQIDCREVRVEIGRPGRKEPITASREIFVVDMKVVVVELEKTEQV